MSDSSAPPTNTETSTGPTSGSGTTAPPTTETTQSPSSTEPPPSTTDNNTTSQNSPPPSSDPPSQTSQLPSQTSGNENTSNTSNPSNTDTNTSTSTTPTSSSESAVSTPLTTVVQTTVITTNAEGAPITTVTSTTIPVGGVVTNPADATSGANSSTPTGAIVGGVVGGVAGVAIFALLFIWGYKRWRRRRDLEAFDGNFDPDRVVATSETGGSRPGSAMFGSGRHRNQESIAPTLPDMAQYDDGMGGRLAGTTIGGGVVSPYPLFGQSASQNGHGSDTTHSYSYNTHSPPPSATFSGGVGDWRHPSPGPSLGTSSSGGMSPSRAAKEREALAGTGGFVGAAGMPIPQHGPPPSSYYNQQSPQSRRMSLESSGAQSGVFYSTNSEYSQPNSSHVGSSGAPRLNVANPDESARQAYLASGPLGSRVGGAGQEEEIPPTYDSLVGSTSGSRSGSGRGEKKEKSGGLRVTNDTNDGEGSGSGA
ncbi:hypothetical protein PQX77_015807 [Marasmius sp. AFHP31]|nr:hypothetical protein PQX77_015807 [Marasmius sp. AFHP31]